MLKLKGMEWLPSKILFALITSILLINLAVPTVYAHRLLILSGEKAGSLQVLYEGGVPARRAVVTIYNELDNVLAEGPVDENGYFFFDPSLKVARVTANDGLGHLAGIDFSTVERRHLPLVSRVLLGLAILGVTGVVFSKASTRRRVTGGGS
ncbi:MAG: hypothetical protein AB1796_11465 [Bacillota bacterium]